MDLVYKKSSQIFNQHHYWTKQPLNAINYFINLHSNPNDTVLDPFCGTGMTGVSAILNNRKAILSDISPICNHISKGYTTILNFQPNEIINILKIITKKIGELYKTKCLNCNTEVDILFSILGEQFLDSSGIKTVDNNLFFDSIINEYSFKKKVGKNNSFSNFELVKIVYKCSCTNKKTYKIPSEEDIELHNKRIWNENNIPKDLFFGKEPKRNFKKGIKQVSDLYSHRNLSALSIIKDEINKIKNEEIKNYFLFCFTSILFNTSLMSRYRKYENTSIKMGTFYIPPMIKDNNVLKSFENKLLKNFKSNHSIYKNSTFNNVRIYNDSATNLNNLKDDSIDYIYTDPPYADVISYSELNLVWESWLELKTQNEFEMIISPSEGKSIDNYFSLFEEFLKKASEKLKKEKKMTLIFHHPNIEFWSLLQNSIVNSNFIPIQTDKPIRIISNSKTSSQHLTDKKSQCFLAFTFINKKNHEFKIENISDEKLNQIILDISKEVKFSRADTYDYLINYLFSRFKIPNSIKI